ncbi:MAG: hypothetical protein ABIQ56_07925 [Chitinophagaceae bacterium]
MTTFEMTMTGLAVVMFLTMAWMIAEFTGMKNEMRERLGINNETLKLQLQAYERVTLLVERISLRNLIGRIPSAGISAREMQGILIESTKTEYDYNLSQQVYVTHDAWRAINNLKEQNIYIINQLAATLPPQATALDLNKRIVDYLMTDEKASLHSIVLEALSYEAKKLL